MTPKPLEQVIQEINQQLNCLLRRGREASEQLETPQHYTNLLTEALAELSIALEELEVMAEELHEKNEELLVTREVLQLERQRYQDLFNSAPDAYFVTDAMGIILDVNETAAQLLEVRSIYLLGKPLVVFVHEAYRLKLNQIILQLQQYQQPLRCQELRLYRSQGGIDIVVEVTAVAMRNAEGEAVSLRWLLRDIQERKQAEAKIREQALLLEVASNPICVQDLEGNILYCNQGTAELYGWQIEEMIHKNANELIYQDPSQGKLAIQSAAKNGFWQGELSQVTKEGKSIFVESRWTLMRDTAGNPTSILVVNTDITEKKQLQKQLFHTQRLESIGTLASGIAHDLNNILTPLITIPQLLSLKIPNLSDSDCELLKILETNAKRGADVVKQILLFARGNESKRIPLSVQELLQEIVKTVKSTFPKSMTIKFETPKQDLWIIPADPTQIHQVLINLLVNARDAMTDGGELSISAENCVIDETFARMHLDAKVGSYIKITITDTGVGIPETIIDRIYDPFFTTKEIGKGTGLGLSTTLGIVKNHGGFIDVSSQVGEGSQFEIYLPSKLELSTELIKDRVVIKGNGELILVVDDESAICQSVKNSLEIYNYKVITAKDGVEAMSLYILYYSDIKVILMDVMMPYMNGAIAIQAVQKINPQVKVIAMSGLVSSGELKQLNPCGIQGFLYKPFTAIELLDTLHKTLSESLP